MSSIRKDFYTRLAYIALSILILLALGEVNGLARFIPLIPFLFAGYHFLMIIACMQLIFDDFFPIKNKEKKKTSSATSSKVIYYFAMTVIVLGLMVMLFESNILENTVRGFHLFKTYAGGGIIIAIFLIILFWMFYPAVFQDSNRRFSVVFGLLFGCFLLTPALASFTNHFYANSSIECKNYLITDKSTGGRRQTSSWLFLNINGDEERFNVPKILYNSVSEGDSIVLCTRMGLLEYEFKEKIMLLHEPPIDTFDVFKEIVVSP